MRRCRRCALPRWRLACTRRPIWRETLLRSYRADEWPRWFDAAGASTPLLRGPVFDSSLAIAAAAAQGLGVGLLPAAMFAADLREGRLVQPFAVELPLGRYWLTRLQSRPPSAAWRAFRCWLVAEALVTPG
jgi:LysR family transcriptional regulator of beta-lactamase